MVKVKISEIKVVFFIFIFFYLNTKATNFLD